MNNGRRGIVLPLLLIVVGAVWLLQTVGLLHAGVWWQLTQLWPVILIAIGLQIVFGATRTGRFVVVAATVALVVGGLFMLGGGGSAESGAEAENGGIGGTTLPIDVPLDDAESASVALAPGIARLRVGAAPSGAEALIEGAVGHPRGDREPEVRIEREGSLLEATIAGREHEGVTFWPFGPRTTLDWTLALSRDVPLRLDVDAGVGEVDLDLRDLDVAYLDLDLGVGSATVDLPGRGVYDVDVDGGIGSIVITIPEGFAAQIGADVGIGDIDVPDGYMVFGDDRWRTADFEGADARADITVDGGIGSIRVRVRD